MPLDNGEKITDPKLILLELENFYTDLYRSTLNKNKEWQINENDVALKFNEEQKQSCEGNITIEEECLTALKSFKANKSPGCDGLPAEFYLAFWNQIGGKLVETSNYCCKKSSLSSSQRRGVIALLEKKGKNQSKIKNWRPVALLNIDYKIFTKALAKRLEEHIPTIINSDQSGFVKGRYIGESVRFVEDLISKFDNENIEGIVLQLDFEKAFDSVEWEFMFEVLRKVNLGDQFISYVRCCYTDIYSCINNNGFATNWFELGRGVRQGCPLSCLLFILCVEIMSNQIRNDRNIKGIFINGIEHKIKQFADDCTCTVKDIPSIYSLIESIKGFSLCSGLKLNAEKSLILFLGPWKNRSIKLGDMKIEPSTLQLLGVEIGRDDIIKKKINLKID